jgi:hypothetical protein
MVVHGLGAYHGDWYLIVKHMRWDVDHGDVMVNLVMNIILILILKLEYGIVKTKKWDNFDGMVT